MVERRLRPACLLSCLLAASAVPHRGHAQTPDPPAASGAQVARAKALFAAGGRAYDNGEFDVALDLFEQAHKAYPKESLLFSLGQAHRRLWGETGDASHKNEAVRYFLEYQAKVTSGKQRAEANNWVLQLTDGKPPTLASLQAAAPTPRAEGRTRLFVTCTVSEAQISVDGGPVHPANKALEVQAGTRALRVFAPGYVEQKLTIDAAAGDVTPLTVELKESPAQLAVTATSGAAVSLDGRLIGRAPLSRPLELMSGAHFVSVELDGHESFAKEVSIERAAKASVTAELSPTGQRYASFATFAGAAVAAAGAGVFTGLALHEQGVANEILTRQNTVGLAPGDLESYEGARSLRDRFALAAGISGGVSGALLATGLGLYLVDPPERIVAPLRAPSSGPSAPAPSSTPDLDSVSITPLLGPHATGASVRGRF